jgi:nitroreductase / dihydropteridine reductase
MIQSNDVLNAMKWRYACKRFDNTKKVPEDVVTDLLQTLNLTATSLGMQLLKVVVVRDSNLKNQILHLAYSQQQVVDCSHLFVLCRYQEVNTTTVEEYVNRSATIRDLDPASPKIQGFRNMVLSTISMPEEKKVNWMTNQVYIALGNLMTACALIGIDSCPMEGFSPEGVDELLGLNDLGLSSVLLFPIGYRHTNDVYADFPKVRRPMEDFVVEV